MVQVEVNVVLGLEEEVQEVLFIILLILWLTEHLILQLLELEGQCQEVLMHREVMEIPVLYLDQDHLQ